MYFGQSATRISEQARILLENLVIKPRRICEMVGFIGTPTCLTSQGYAAQEHPKNTSNDRTDFYGLGKGWRIIFVIFFTPSNNGADAVDELVADSVQNQHRVFTLA